MQQNQNVRLDRIDSLTNSLQQIQKELTRVTEKVNGTNPNFMNKALNSFEGDKVGDTDIKELELPRQHRAGANVRRGSHDARQQRPDACRQPGVRRACHKPGFQP